MATPEHHASIAIIGAGICGVSFLERLIANLPEVGPSTGLTIYMIDPYPAGPGRVWRNAQSGVLQSNSIAANLTMFTDDSVTCEGPILPGPSLPEWAQGVRDGSIHVDGVSPEIREEIEGLGEWSYPTRRLVSVYLTWAFERIAQGTPRGVAIRFLQSRATSVSDLPSGQQQIQLAGGLGPVVADAVVLAVGHLDAEPTPEEQKLSDFASRHSNLYLASGYSADVDLSPITPGMPVIVRGLGLAFIDLMAMLTEGRGGRYEQLADGQLRYVASGLEPILWAGSRRGVPHNSKPGYRLQPSSLDLPRFCDADVIDAGLAGAAEIDYGRDLEPHVCKELAWSYYHELFSAHSERCAMSFDQFTSAFAECEWGSDAMAALIAQAVPCEADRLDLRSLDRPLAGMHFDSLAALREFVCQHIAADLDRRVNASYGADMRMVKGFSSVVTQISQLACLAALEPSSRRAKVDGRLMSLYKKVGSGPPPERLRQLTALAEAGFVQFLGSEMWVEADDQRGVFRAGSGNVDHVIEASALVEARLPDPTVLHSASELIRSLRDAGGATEQVVTSGNGHTYEQGLLPVDPVDARVLGLHGVPHERRFALGPFTSGSSLPSFIVPRSNAATLRQNDATARRLLQMLGTSLGGRAGAVQVSSIYESSLDRGPAALAP